MLKRKLPTLQSIRRGLLAVGVITMVLLFLYAGQGPLPETPLWSSRADTAGDLPGDSHSQRWQDCRRLLRMTDTHFNWESDDDNGSGEQDRCRRTQRSDEDLRQSLRKLKELKGRAARLVFIGDSRIRILSETLTERLEMKPQNSSRVPPVFSSDPYHPKELFQEGGPLRENVTNLQPGCIEAHVIQGATVTFHCSLNFTSGSFRSEFWWRPYIDEIFADKLDAVLSECASGECPDIVILDSGAWYAAIYPLFPGDDRPARAARFIGEISAISDKIARLASQTRVLWKLDENFMGEMVNGRKTRHVNQVLMVLSSIIYDAATQMPELNVWSSGYVEAMRFYHEVCQPNRETLLISGFEPVRHECLDPMHIGNTVRWRLIQTILNVLLQDIADPVEGLCCGK